MDSLPNFITAGAPLHLLRTHGAPLIHIWMQRKCRCVWPEACVSELMHLHLWPEIRQCTFKFSRMYELFLHYQCSTLKVAFWWPQIVKWLSDIIYRPPWKKHVWCNFMWRVMVLTTFIGGTSFFMCYAQSCSKCCSKFVLTTGTLLKSISMELVYS